MATWGQLAEDNRLAAYETFEKWRWRTCISRAYYAVFSAATEALAKQGVTMPKGQNSPSHKKVPVLVGNNLTGVSHPLRWRLARLVGRLYTMRLQADYMPDWPLEEADARDALGLMSAAFRCLRR